MKAVICLFVAGAVAMASVPAALAGMVVDLGETSHYIKLSNDYSNAAVAAILPYFSEAATKLGLPIHTPIVQADILRSHVLAFRDLEVSVMLKDRRAFTYSHGVVDRITDSRGFSALQDPAQIKRYYGTIAISQDDAVNVARTALTTLGIPLDVVFADQPPVVVPPPVIDSNTVPDFEIKWLDPRGGQTVDIHVNGSTRRVERLALFSKNISRKNPQLTAPTVTFAQGDYQKTIPRYFFSWNFENAAKDDLQSKVEAEVNADNGHVESLYYDDKAYWGARPAVTAPISLGHGYPHIEMNQH